ncbi:M56 family metallopeptidase [uncultured Bacteroides sp.]|uniref:M56 family metallopeptidase n=1 Tax=uncultured Bacteroides sp. TaxID=162156 RepID=UPI00261B0A60|nr:M56 family metallopeptidase [uncultured Bacteroides sp.]
MLAYFLKINVAIALFYAFYRLFFYKDTFFTWRRTALLCFFAVSALYPLLNIQTWITEQKPMVAMADLYADIILPEITLMPEQTDTDWKTLLHHAAGFTYWGVVVLLAIRLLIQLIGIIRLSFRCRKTRINGTDVRLLKQADGPFSFFHWIFIYPDNHTEEELNEILTHEQTHASQWHSVDVLISETVCIFCWFNPFAWLMKREIRTNLEYLADNRVLETGYDSKTYQYHLLGLSHHKAAATIYNSFNVLPLKKRIKMMNKKRTREIGRTKYIMFLPLAALLMIISNIEAVARTTKEVTKDVIEAAEENLTSKVTPPDTEVTTGRNVKTETETLPETTETQSETTATQPETPAPQQDKDKLVTYQGVVVNKDDNPVLEVAEQMPVFPDGGMPGLMQFLAKNIKYPINAQKNGTQGRVTAQFIVNTDGSISNVEILRGVDPDLDSEAVRVISTMPNWKPGMQKGKAVRVKYTIPVMFRLNNEKKEEHKPVQTINESIAGTGRTNQKAMPEKPEEHVVFETVEQMPSFPGGMTGLMQYLSRNIKYPAEAQKAGIQGKVIVQVVIDVNGNATTPKIIKGADPSLDAEAIRVAANMPKWKPGMQRGKAINVRYAFPIDFKLQ